MRALYSCHAAEIQVGDRVSFVNDREERDTIEVFKLVRDCGCLHVWPSVGRVITFRNDYEVMIER